MITPSALTLTRVADTRQSDPGAREPWKDRAGCREWDFSAGDPWFEPIKGKKGRDRYPATVREVCQACPVRALCARDVMEFEATNDGPRYGYVAGMTPEERSALALLGVVSA